ncbi:hypothetical protein [Pectobacterium aroidearum]|uniref:hypothetical protein n=1 Tax=Pectobacterium aroidearum TaxID=1201031 RepID=UPI003158E091
MTPSNFRALMDATLSDFLCRAIPARHPSGRRKRRLKSLLAIFYVGYPCPTPCGSLQKQR